MWAAPVRSPITARTLLNRRRTCAGLAMPVVSDRPASSTPAATACAGHPDHVLVADLALDRAAEGSRDAGLDLHAGRDLVTQAGDGAYLLDHLLARLAHVGHHVRCAGRDRDGQLVHAGAQRGLGAAQVGHQGHHGHAGVRQRVAHDLGGIGHLRQQLGRHERADLDLAQARGHQRVDPDELVGGGHHGLDRLQAVAGADLADQDVGLDGARTHGSHSWVISG